MELLQHNLAALVQPLGLVWLGLVFLTVRLVRRSQPVTALVPGALALALVAAGSTPGPAQLLGRLERPYLAGKLEDLPPADAVVVLGGGIRPSARAAHGLDLTDAADRIMTGVEVVRLGKAPNLVLGGATRTAPGGREVSEPELTRQWLASWPLTGVPMFILPGCHDTHDEALGTLALLKDRHWKRVLLVTSAYHMRRAAAVFQTAGVPVVCVACDYQGRPGGWEGWDWILAPQQGPLRQLELWLHEEIGWEYYRVRGWIR
jgi:uncharacterized SAM-binding protein YcdF (DUF218 family)